MSQESGRTGRIAAAAATAAAAAAAARAAVGGRRRRPEVADHVAVKELHLVAHGGLALHVRRHRSTDLTDPAARIVFVHGWGMGADFWDDAARRLAALGLETVTYDQRGHGRSETPRDITAGCTIEALGRDLGAILKATSAPPVPTILVGHSMGGMAILSWAGTMAREPDAEAPAPAAALLWNTAFHDFIPDTFAALTRSSDPRLHRLANLALHSSLPIPGGRASRPVIRRIGHGPNAPRRAVALSHELLTSLDPRVRVAFAPQFEDLDLREDVPHLRIPTLVVTGANDLLTPPGHGARLAEELPNGHLLSLPGAGHQAPLDHPDLVIDLVLQRLRTSVAIPADHPAALSPLQARVAWSVIDGDVA